MGAVPTRSFFILRLRQFFTSEVAGQSMRAGGATALAEAGVAPSIIQAAGRWASEAFLVYIRMFLDLLSLESPPIGVFHLISLLTFFLFVYFFFKKNDP